MAHLPTQGEANWGSALNEFLLVSHHENGELLHQLDIINVRDYGATGDDSQSPFETASAVQAAMAAGKHLYFPRGTYWFTSWTFDQDYQRVTFAPDALLKPATETSVIHFSGNYQTVEYLHIYVDQESERPIPTTPKWPDGLLHFSGTNTIIANLSIDAFARIGRLVKVSNAFDTRFENIQLLAPNTTEGVHLAALTKCIFSGGAIKGNNSPIKVADSAGLIIGADEASVSAYEVRAFGLTVHHWATGVRFSGISHQDPNFFGCNFENNLFYGLSVEPPASGQGLGVVYNLGLFGCHFEGTYQALHVATNGHIQGAIISGCLFSLNIAPASEAALTEEQRLPQRIINAQGHLRGVVMSGCFNTGSHNKPDAYIWGIDGSAYNCADLFNYWADMPNDNFSTGGSADQVIQMTTLGDSGNGRSLDLKGWFRHHGDGLGFYGAAPVTQPGGYTALGNQAVLTDVVQRLNQLTTDLAAVGLIKQT